MDGSMSRTLMYALAIVAVLFAAISAAVWFTAYHPGEVRSEDVFRTGSPPVLKPGQRVKVLSWNVQFMAGKGYHFFFEGGKDLRPSPEDIRNTLDAVAGIIRNEDPDIILLQEVDVGARRTDYMDQVQELLKRLPDTYLCRASTFYWKALFVPHPKIMGSVGLKLLTLSKYRIDSATRYQLPLIPENFLRQQFNLRRALLETRFPISGGGVFTVMNTHLSAFSAGTDTLELQVHEVKTILDKLSENHIAWIAGGDFNLLPPGPEAYNRLPEFEKSDYRRESEIKSLFAKYRAVPGTEEVKGAGYEKWYTHFPNGPHPGRPDKTIDYIFYSVDLALGRHYVRRNDTLDISDHLPVVAEFTLPIKK